MVLSLTRIIVFYSILWSIGLHVPFTTLCKIFTSTSLSVELYRFSNKAYTTTYSHIAKSNKECLESLFAIKIRNTNHPTIPFLSSLELNNPAVL